jgi:deoxyribonuclease-4
MPLFGAHMSIAGGLHNAVAAAMELKCDTLQLFTKNANQWLGKSLNDDEIRRFSRALRASNLKYPTAHDSYLINLASSDDSLYRKSIAAFVAELERAESLGLSYLVMHPGAHTGSGEAAGLARVVAALDEVHAGCRGFKVKVLLENTAGQGSCLGHRFEHLATVLSEVKDSSWLGVCFDTCHAFAAGYPLRSANDYCDTFEEFDRLIGLDRLKLFHLNDSAKELGSRVDRHAGIGLGKIGTTVFRCIVNDPRFAKLPMILETPKEDLHGKAMDPENLAVLRGFLPNSRRGTNARKRVKPTFSPADQ